jgi:hypothetical protein
MTTDIALATGEAERSVVFHDCRSHGPRHFRCLLWVRVINFAAGIDFVFGRYELEPFIRDLELLNQSLKGRAKFKPDCEDSSIQLEGDGLGHIKVSGTLIQGGPDTQRLEFEFRTDQTCLAPFIRDLKTLVAEPVA